MNILTKILNIFTLNSTTPTLGVKGISDQVVSFIKEVKCDPDRFTLFTRDRELYNVMYELVEIRDLSIEDVVKHLPPLYRVNPHRGKVPFGMFDYEPQLSLYDHVTDHVFYVYTKTNPSTGLKEITKVKGERWLTKEELLYLTNELLTSYSPDKLKLVKEKRIVLNEERRRKRKIRLENNVRVEELKSVYCKQEEK